MTKTHPGAELDQARLGQGPGRHGTDSEPPGCPPQQHGSPVGSAAASSSSRRVSAGNASIRRRKLSSIAPAAGPRPGSPNPPASSAGVHPRGSSNSASGLPRASATIWSRTCTSSGAASTESSSARIGVPQAPEDQLRQPRQLTFQDTAPEHQADRLHPQAARNKREDLRRGAIEPLRVIDQANQRPFLCHLRQQAQNGQTDQEPVRYRPGTDGESGPQGIALRDRESLQAIQHRRAQLVQRGERQLHLRLDTGGAPHAAFRRLPGQVLQQRCLADTRFAMHDQCPALTCANSLNEPVKRATFGAAAHQLRHASPHRKACGYLHDYDAVPRPWPAH
jgi:hypothetical protein